MLGNTVASGLAAAHQIGLIHRDIKPANIWLEAETSNVKILDFGLVRATDEDPRLTCTGMIAGTPCYMSPEQSRGAELDCRSDFFSLGCLLYESLTGQLPFCSNNLLATLQSIQRDAPATPSELEPDVPQGQAEAFETPADAFQKYWNPFRRESGESESGETNQDSNDDVDDFTREIARFDGRSLSFTSRRWNINPN